MIEVSPAVATHATTHAMRFREVAGAQGVPLNVVEAGDRSKPSILFLHGLRQSYLSFKFQLESELARHFHLVALDLRGHGNSGKPYAPDSYRENRLWAEDIARVMEATDIDRCVIVGWSYGTLVAADYIRFYGTDALAGLVLTGAFGGLTAPPPSCADPHRAAALKRAQDIGSSLDIEDHIESARIMVNLLTVKPLSTDWRERTLLMNMMVPAYVRKLLWLRRVDNTDLLEKIAIPVLLIIGGSDFNVPSDQGKDLAARLGHAEISVFEGDGHSPFAESPERFNAELARFTARVTLDGMK